MGAVEDAIEQMRAAVSEAMFDPAHADDATEKVIRDAIERSGVADEFTIEQVEPSEFKVVFRPKMPLDFITITLPERVSLTDEEVEEINAKYGGGS